MFTFLPGPFLVQFSGPFYLSTDTSKISDIERGKKGVEPDFLERLKKRYRLIIQYKNT
jgi:hypothetical protein